MTQITLFFHFLWFMACNSYIGCIQFTPMKSDRIALLLIFALMAVGGLAILFAFILWFLS